MTVQHFDLHAPSLDHLRITYAATMEHAGDLLQCPAHFSIRGRHAQTLSTVIYHGRRDPAEDMLDWGFGGPTFECMNLVHDPDCVILQGCPPSSVALAAGMGLSTHDDSLLIPYHDDMLMIPLYQGAPAYFGDFVVSLKETTR